MTEKQKLVAGWMAVAGRIRLEEVESDRIKQDQGGAGRIMSEQVGVGRIR